MEYYHYDLNAADASLTTTDSAHELRDPNTMKIMNTVLNANPQKLQEVAASQLELLNRYRKNVLEQAQESFFWALIAALAGILLLFATIIIFLVTRSLNVSIISGIGSIVVETVSGLIFFLRTQSLKQLEIFSESLVKVNYYMLANSLCESISNSQLQDATRVEVVRGMIFNATSYAQAQYTSASVPPPPPPDSSPYLPSTYTPPSDPYPYSSPPASYAPVTRKL
jgi:hypothetical protein